MQRCRLSYSQAAHASCLEPQLHCSSHLPPSHQVKMFGGYTRWHADLPAPVDALPARTLLSAVDTAVQYAAAGLPPGPVHLNCQFR